MMMKIILQTLYIITGITIMRRKPTTAASLSFSITTSLIYYDF